MQICAYFLNDDKPYSACNARNINIFNNNSKPVIEPIAEKFTLKEGESFRYQVKATDPDGDSIGYRFVTTIEALTIDANTGLINSLPLSIGNNSKVEYQITVAADDKVSGASTRTFIIEVQKLIFTEDPEGQINTYNPENFKFISPSKDFVTSDKQLTVKWDLGNSEGVEELSLEYTTDGENWNKLGESFSPERKYFIWDISNLEDGDYALRLNIKQKNGETLNQLSDGFTIKKESGEPSEVESIPLIANVSPANESTVEAKKPIISGELIPSEGNTINLESLEIKLDGKEFEQNCQIEPALFTCNPSEELEEGLHLVSVVAKDTSEKEASLEWTFSVDTIVDEPLPGAPEEEDETILILGNDVPRATVVFIALIFCIGLALLIIPWILLGIWSGRNKKSKEVNTVLVNANALPQINAYSTNAPIPAYEPENFAYKPTEITEYEVNTANPQEVVNVTDQTQVQTEPLQPAEPVPVENKDTIIEPDPVVVPVPVEVQTETPKTEEIIVEPYNTQIDNTTSSQQTVDVQPYNFQTFKPVPEFKPIDVKSLTPTSPQTDNTLISQPVDIAQPSNITPVEPVNAYVEPTSINNDIITPQPVETIEEIQPVETQPIAPVQPLADDNFPQSNGIATANLQPSESQTTEPVNLNNQQPVNSSTVQSENIQPLNTQGNYQYPTQIQNTDPILQPYTNTTSQYQYPAQSLAQDSRQTLKPYDYATSNPIDVDQYGNAIDPNVQDLETDAFGNVPINNSGVYVGQDVNFNDPNNRLAPQQMDGSKMEDDAIPKETKDTNQTPGANATNDNTKGKEELKPNPAPTTPTI